MTPAQEHLGIMTEYSSMTPAEVRKAIEREDFYLARSLRPDVFPQGEHEDATGESPDIVVRGPDLHYGVEVTGMVTPEEKAQEDVRAEVCVRAKARAGLPPGFDIIVVFRRETFIGHVRERERLARLLVDLVEAKAAVRDHSTKWLEQVTSVGDALTAWVTSVFIHHLPGVPSTTWHSQEYWAIGPLLPRDVRQRIAAKEAKLGAYRRRAPKVALLLVISGTSGAESSHIPLITRQATYRTNFDTVAILDRMNADLVLLETSPLT